MRDCGVGEKLSKFKKSLPGSKSSCPYLRSLVHYGTTSTIASVTSSINTHENNMNVTLTTIPYTHVHV